VSLLIPSAIGSIPFAENAYTVLDALESRRDEDPSARVGLRGLGGSGRQECGFSP
jgi:hypothetical protein